MPSLTFADPDFDDSEWRSAQFDENGIGYGQAVDLAYGVKLGVPDWGDRYSAYFRTRFMTQGFLRSMAVEMACDDGAIIYVDGKEVARHNVRAGPEAYRLMSTRAVSQADELVVVTVLFDVGESPPGEHVLAISLHNSDKNSSDLGLRQVVLYGSTESLPPTRGE